MEQAFALHTDYAPQGDQPAAIAQIAANIEAGVRDQVLPGVTGSGKTFTMAQVVAHCRRPALVPAPNKTLPSGFSCVAGRESKSRQCRAQRKKLLCRDLAAMPEVVEAFSPQAPHAG